jgi:hypothetical protein
MDTSGFYKVDPIAGLLFGPNFVLNANYELRRETKDDNTYPVDEWYWFDSEEDARLFFNLPAPEPEPVPEDNTE